MTNGSNNDYRIKILVVHPDGRRQKFLVTFPERKSLKVDQRYIGLPLTLRVEFIPGAIMVKPGTGHTLTIADRPVKEHSVQLNDVVGLDQYMIEFLELPEPLPLADEATRFVNINEMVEATVIAQIPSEPIVPTQKVESTKQDHFRHELTPTPTPQLPKAPPSSASMASSGSSSSTLQSAPMSQMDPEDSTALIRRLQVPGSNVPNARKYQSLEPTAPSEASGPHDRETTSTDAHETTAGGIQMPGFLHSRTNQIALGAALIVLLGLFLARRPSSNEDTTSGRAQTANVQPEETTPSFDESQFGDSQIDIPAPKEIVTEEPSTASAAATEPTQNSEPSQPVVPMGTVAKPEALDLGFDDRTGFDPISIEQFFAAVDNSDERRIKEILDSRQVDVNLSRRRGYAALHLAAAQGQIDVVKLLIKKKADPNVIDSSGATPLMWAVFRKHREVAKFLAPRTDLKIQRQGGETAFDLAKRMNQRDLLSALNPDGKKGSFSQNRKSKSRAPAKASSGSKSSSEQKKKSR